MFEYHHYNQLFRDYTELDLLNTSDVYLYNVYKLTSDDGDILYLRKSLIDSIRETNKIPENVDRNVQIEDDNIIIDNIHYTITIPDKSWDEENIRRKEENSIDNAKQKYFAVYSEDAIGVCIDTDINLDLCSIYVEPYSLANANQYGSLSTVYGDQSLSFGMTDPNNIIIQNSEFTHYMPFYSVGNITRLFISMVELEGFSEIKLNTTIPIFISFLRIILLSIVIILIYAYKTNKLNSILHLKLDLSDKRQFRGYVTTLFLLVAYLLVYFSVSNPVSAGKDSFQQYNVHLVDSILAGRSYLDIEPSELFLSMENKYDYVSWLESGVPDAGTNDELYFDLAYYKDHFYSYFGIVPAILTFVPYKLIFGTYMSYSLATLLYTAIAWFFLIKTWRLYVENRFKDISLITFLLTCILISISNYSLTALILHGVYGVVQISGLAFCSIGLYK